MVLGHIPVHHVGFIINVREYKPEPHGYGLVVLHGVDAHVPRQNGVIKVHKHFLIVTSTSIEYLPIIDFLPPFSIHTVGDKELADPAFLPFVALHDDPSDHVFDDRAGVQGRAPWPVCRRTVRTSNVRVKGPVKPPPAFDPAGRPVRAHSSTPGHELVHRPIRGAEPVAPKRYLVGHR